MRPIAHHGCGSCDGGREVRADATALVATKTKCHQTRRNVARKSRKLERVQRQAAIDHMYLALLARTRERKYPDIEAHENLHGFTLREKIPMIDTRVSFGEKIISRKLPDKSRLRATRISSDTFVRRSLAIFSDFVLEIESRETTLRVVRPIRRHDGTLLQRDATHC